jgi:hypothetical protein
MALAADALGRGVVELLQLEKSAYALLRADDARRARNAAAVIASVLAPRKPVRRAAGQTTCRGTIRADDVWDAVSRVAANGRAGSGSDPRAVVPVGRRGVPGASVVSQSLGQD